MTFVYAAALGIALLAAAPFIAHLLQRRRADERDFPPARLVPPSPPVARRRRHIDDRALYGVRTAAVLALALLGATPFVRCSSLALGREGGASIALAIVLDDSLSMLAEVEGKTRWDRALRAADDLVDGAREGDAVGVVLAGSPPRIALAPTTDLAAARSVVQSLSASHRATALEGALELAQSILHGLPQTDRRLVLLSDLADGHSDGPPLGESSEIPLWIPLTDLTEPAPNCAVVRADRQRDRATVRVACFPSGEGRRRSIEVFAGEKVVGRTPLPDEAPGIDVSVELTDATGDLMARVTGKDSIRADDVAPVLATTGGLSIGIVADPAGAKLVTGGAPPVEQALASLELDVRLRPLPLLPDRPEDLAGFAGLVIEDPPGFTPEARRSLAAWTDRGGVVLLALGPHAPLAPLGANFEPLVPGSIGWGTSPAAGLDDNASVLFGSAAAGLLDIRPRGRATIDLGALGSTAQVTARWKDGAPWLIERPLGRGFVFVLTLPTSPDESDLALRPAFLMLLDRVVDATRTRNGAYRITVGEAWAFEGAKSLDVLGPEKTRLRPTEEPTRKVVVPDRIGLYEIALDHDKLTRVVAASEREVDERPRRVNPDTGSSSLGDTRAKVDLSPYLAIALLALLVGELALRLRARRTLGAVLGATFALTLSCRSAGPYGYSRVYTPTSDEAQAVTGKPELDPRGVARSTDRRRAFWTFGVVTHRSPGPGGAAYVALSLRALSPQNQCTSRDEDTCRVTVGDRETGRAHALLTLTAEDDLGERSVALGSLVRVVGSIAEDVDPADGSAIVRATFYRHWPRGFYTAAKSDGPAARR